MKSQVLHTMWCYNFWQGCRGHLKLITQSEVKGLMGNSHMDTPPKKGPKITQHWKEVWPPLNSLPSLCFPIKCLLRYPSPSSMSYDTMLLTFWKRWKMWRKRASWRFRTDRFFACNECTTRRLASIPATLGTNWRAAEIQATRRHHLIMW